MSFSVNLHGLSLVVNYRHQIICSFIGIVRNSTALGRTLVGSGHARGLCVLPTSRAHSGSTLAHRKITGILSSLGTVSFRFVIYSSPTKVRANTLVTLCFTSRTVVAAGPRISSMHSSSHVLNVLTSGSHHTRGNRRPVGRRLLLAHCGPNHMDENSVLDVRSILRVLHVGLINIVPRSRSMLHTSGRNRPIVLSVGTSTNGTCTSAMRHLLKRRHPFHFVRRRGGNFLGHLFKKWIVTLLSFFLSQGGGATGVTGRQLRVVITRHHHDSTRPRCLPRLHGSVLRIVYGCMRVSPRVMAMRLRRGSNSVSVLRLGIALPRTRRLGWTHYGDTFVFGTRLSLP